MGWLGKGSGSIVDYNNVSDLAAQIVELREKNRKLESSANSYKNINDMLVERYQGYVDTNARLNTYVDELTQKQDAPRRYRVTFNNGPSDIEVKATHFVASPENGYNFYDKTGVSKLTAHFDYGIVAYVIEAQEAV